ncbi:hypothetical protein GCM10025864_26780 [Luteimicrobium album]|uniref:Uncharacterized protein n=1 Tax=Luteimicrobium album TaxID=1054550 RepID=A0ABQ6I520_9MICO|nr:hypothetical protein GCM10025864_26780 [Luteimicrobium album]
MDGVHPGGVYGRSVVIGREGPRKVETSARLPVPETGQERTEASARWDDDGGFEPDADDDEVSPASGAPGASHPA